MHPVAQLPIDGHVFSDRADANYHAQQIIALIAEVVPPGNIEKIDAQLPEEFDPPVRTSRGGPIRRGVASYASTLKKPIE